MISFKQFINEHLSSSEQEVVDEMKLDTSAGKENFKGIIPEGQTHTEIPIQNPLDLKINEHLKANPVTDKAGNHLGHYKRDEADPKMVVHPDGRKVKLSGVLKSNPPLLKEYAEAGSRVSKPPESGKEVSGQTRWTAPAIDKSQRKIYISNHPHACFGKSQGKPWRSCADWGSGHAADHLESDVEQGGGAAFLTHTDEPTPSNPKRAVGRVAIHPYHAIDEEGKIIRDENGGSAHTILRASAKRYGEDDAHESFHKTVTQHLEEKHPMIYSRYKLNSQVYQGDDADNKIIERPLTEDEKKPHIENLDFGVKMGYSSPDDIVHAVKHNYLTQSHIDTIAKTKTQSPSHLELAIAHKNGKVKLSNDNINDITKHGNALAADELSLAHKHGITIPDEALNNIAKNPTAIAAHEHLTQAFLDNKHLPDSAINTIASNPKSKWAHYNLAASHANGTKIPDEAIHSIVHNPISADARKELLSGHLHGQSIPDEAIDYMAKNGFEGEHTGIVKAHLAGKKVSDEAIGHIVKSPFSTIAHSLLAGAHAEGRTKLSDDALNTITSNDHSRAAHDKLALAHKAGKTLPDESVFNLKKRGHDL
jgi:hypothetical protein